MVSCTLHLEQQLSRAFKDDTLHPLKKFCILSENVIFHE